MVVNVVKKPSTSSSSLPRGSYSAVNNYIIDALLICSPTLKDRTKPRPPYPDEKGEMHVVSKIYMNLFNR